MWELILQKISSNFAYILVAHFSPQRNFVSLSLGMEVLQYGRKMEHEGLVMVHVSFPFLTVECINKNE